MVSPFLLTDLRACVLSMVYRKGICVCLGLYGLKSPYFHLFRVPSAHVGDHGRV